MTDPTSTPTAALLRDFAMRRSRAGTDDRKLLLAAALLASAETRAHGLRELIGTCREKAQRLSALAEKRDLSGLSQTAEIDRAEASHLRWFADELDAALSASAPPASLQQTKEEA